MLGPLVPRSSGVLLHPTALPGHFGIGDLGPSAHAWIDALARAGQRWWQVLPLGPTGYRDSPYQSASTFAGNLNLISPELVAADSLACLGDSDGCVLPTSGPVHFSEVIPRKRRLVREAWKRFSASDGYANLRSAFDRFQSAEAAWLEDYVLFAAIKDHLGGKPWWEWPPPLAAHDETALKTIGAELQEEIGAHRFGQFLFFRQWKALRDHAAAKGIRIIGDLPIYVAEDSADVWGSPHLFQLGPDRRPTIVAGVPPDYFTASGQLWGNPIYNWDVHLRSDFAWWIDRVRAALKLFDVIRLDHFRGLESYWAVPAGSATAACGQWKPGPGAAILHALQEALGTMPIIAEDLGFITPPVEQLRAQFDLPGMRILQFAFGGAVESRFLPHNYDRTVVAYTGTHDNDTTAGWAGKLTAEERRAFADYVPLANNEPVEALIRLAWGSVADLAIAPLQDVLGLGTESRFNFPGTLEGNWTWRMAGSVLENLDWADRLRRLTEVYGRH
ncbi:MAG TPA: 4-alpha-glucanotransferase [Urbifossiella sp.]|nr:4-alpha-glucanotransferase [Urbifossiella sp.]